MSGSGGNTPYTFDWGGLDPNALPAGTHTITITDNEGCSTTCSVTITQPSQLTSSITSQTGVACYDAPIGSVTVAGANGTPGYTYSIDGGTTYQVSGIFNGLAAGNYTVTVRDSKLCTTDQAVTITGPTQELLANVQLTNPGCTQDGTIGVLVVGSGDNGGPYEYQMNGIGGWTTNGDFGAQPDGTYTFQTRDVNGCLSPIETVEIVDSTPVKVTIFASFDVTCFGATTGTANAVATSGKAPYTYSWNTTPVQTTANATGLPAGTYTITVTDFNGCTATDTVTITEQTEIIITPTPTNITCYNGSDGSIIANASGGVGSYQYNIDGQPFQVSNAFNGLSEGTYTIGVLDSNGCIVTVDVTLTEPSQITASFTTATIGCAGNGIATVTASGGVGPYTYLWAFGPTAGDTITGLSTGTYSVTITDASNCTFTTNINYTDPAALTVSVSATVTSGTGQSDGTATATASGGSGSYTYSWDDPSSQTTPTATGLLQGVYTVTVTDSNGCVATENVIVADAIIISTFIEDLNYEIGCTVGDDLEQITISPTVTGGYGTLVYTWDYGINSTKLTGDDLDGQKTIAYTFGGTKTISVSITDGSGQTVSISFDIYIDSCIVFDVDCDRCVAQDYQLLDWYIGDVNGDPLKTCATPGELINKDVYIWFYLDHNDNTNYSLTVVAEYTTTNPITGEVVVDAVENCLYEGEVIRLGEANLFIDDSYVCGSSIVITKFLISWNKLASTPCRQDEPKCYCPGFDIVVTPPLTAVVVGTDILCYNGIDNGTADVSIYGGTAPYTYAWSTLDGSGLNVTAEDQTGLSSGIYQVIVTDSTTRYDEDLETNVPDPISIILTVTIGEPPALVIDNITFTEPLCNGDSNRTATANVSGGTPGYTYSWNTVPIQTTQTATGLSAGTYTVTVTDANGCTTQQSVIITEPPVLSASISSVEPLCFGDGNGSATVTTSGGTSPYAYLWNTGSTAATATNLSAENYSVTVTDANNCTTVTNVTIGQPTFLTATISSTNVVCNGDGDGTATVTPSGGTPGYSYSWNTVPIQTTQTTIGLSPGTYNVQVTDTNGCLVYQNITITEPSILTVSTDFTEPLCFTSANGGTATANASGGTGQYSYLWTPGGQTTQTANGLSAGTYIVVVTDENSCTATTSVDVTIPLQTNADAGPDQILTALDCGINSVTMDATNTTGYTGIWTIISGTGGSFSDINDGNAEFSGLEGQTYILRWSITCAEDDMQVTFAGNCSTLDFDGINDHITFGDNYDVSGAFSFEIWIKPEALSGIETILSKRESSDLSTGYDLHLDGNLLKLRFNNSFTLTSGNAITTNRWYHVAATYDGSTALLYIDGIQVATGNTGTGSTANSHEFIVGAMDNTINSPRNPVNYFEGWMDELRVWNVALSPAQIRHMMNQEIEVSGANVWGSIVPLQIQGLTWANLDGYYQMNQSVDVTASGFLNANDSTPTSGTLKNITTWQLETAPLLYVSVRDGNWNNTTAATPWLHGDTVWDYPNALGVNGTGIDWNIVRSLHNITSNTQDVTILGLFVENELTITDTGTQDETNNGHGLWVTHYLKLDGLIDLIGESQLVQKRYTPSQVNGSILDVTSAGYLERDCSLRYIVYTS